MKVLLRRSCVWLTVLMGTGCSDAVAPGQYVGVYQLTTVGGAALPVDAGADVTRFGQPTGCRVMLIGGELRLEPDRTFTRTEQHSRCPHTTIIPGEMRGTYAVRNSAIEFRLTAPDTTLILVGSVSSGAVRMVEDGVSYEFRSR